MKRLLRNQTGKRWQYYVWLLVVARLLLPFAADINLVGSVIQETGRDASADSREVMAYGQQTDMSAGPVSDRDEGTQSGVLSNLGKADDKSPESVGMVYKGPVWLEYVYEYLWVIWLAPALALLLRKITIYQSFVRYVKAGWKPVDDIALLDSLAGCGERLGVKKVIGLYSNPLISSPMLLGFFRPNIVLNGEQICEEELRNIVLHELVHYRRRDMLYKWLVQLAVCVHWFNPAVYWMEREISRDCELACDEAVIRMLDSEGRKAYGDTLLHAMCGMGGYKESELYPLSRTFLKVGQLILGRLFYICILPLDLLFSFFMVFCYGFK